MDRISWDGDRDLDLMLANLKKAIESDGGACLRGAIGDERTRATPIGLSRPARGPEEHRGTQVGDPAR